MEELKKDNLLITVWGGFELSSFRECDIDNECVLLEKETNRRVNQSEA